MNFLKESKLLRRTALALLLTAALFLTYPFSCHAQDAQWNQVNIGGSKVLTPQFPLFQAKIYGGSPGQSVCVGADGSIVGSGCSSSARGFVYPESYGATGSGAVDTTGTETTALQACINASSAVVTCKLNPASGTYRVSGQLTLPSRAHVEGNSLYGTTIHSDYNGDEIALSNGPVQGVILANFTLKCNATNASSRGMNLAAVPTGSPSQGGLWDSKISFVEIDQCALEGLWLNAGTSELNNPNQFVQLDHVNINGPTQSHPAALEKISGRNGQFIQASGQINGDGVMSDYPNALVDIEPLNGNEAAYDYNFDTVTFQGGALCIYDNVGTNVTIDHGYFEDCQGAVSGNDTYTLNVINSQFNSSGFSSTPIIKFNNQSTGTVANNSVLNNGSFPLYAFMQCQNSNHIEVAGNHNNNAPATSHSGVGPPLPISNCVTEQVGTATTLNLWSDVTYLNADNGASPIQNIVAATNDGHDVTIMTATNGSNTYAEYVSGGNFTLGSFLSPLIVPAPCPVTFRLDDLTGNYRLVSAPCNVPTVNELSGAVTGSYPPFFDPYITSTNSGATSGIPSGYHCSIAGAYNGSGANYAEWASCTPNGSSGNYLYSSNGTARGSESFIAAGLTATKTAGACTFTITGGLITAVTGC